MKEAYVGYEAAKRLKDKGFDWGCCSYWCVFPNGDIVHTDYGHFANHNGDETDKFVSRPTQQMAMRWLREEKNIDIVPFHEQLSNDCYWCRIEHNLLTAHQQPPIYPTYEDAVEAALQYCLTILV